MRSRPCTVSRPSAAAATLALSLAMALAAVPPALDAQSLGGREHRLPAANLVIPQVRCYAPGSRAEPVTITGVTASVEILEQVAVTVLDISLANRGGRQEEAQVLVPVPDGAVVKSFLFEGTASEPTARLLPKAEAKALYDSIVRSLRDPALLEFAGYNLIQSSVFPVPAGGGQRVRLAYEHLLSSDGPRVDYVLPRSEASLPGAASWKISVRVRSRRPISTLYSPTHRIVMERSAPGDAAARLADQSAEAGPFRLSYLVGGEGVSASLLAYPDPRTGGGYFLLLAGLPNEPAAGDAVTRREVTIVLDCSGSMAGEKFEQARASALQVIEGLAPGEAFNIIDYAAGVSRFAPQPVIKDAKSIAEAREYLRRLRTSGGTNIHDALVEAMRQPLAAVEAAAGSAPMLPLVLFLTDGLPTVGITGEAAIRQAADKANTHNRRLFTIGLGYDVNAPLLGGLAQAARGAATFILPAENVEVKVSGVFQRLYGPTLADPKLETLAPDGNVTTRAVRDVMPHQIPDLFEGDQLVVLGQYQGEGPLSFRLKGNCRGRPREFAFRFGLETATTRNSFVPRLWASRKIAMLVDAIRERGVRETSPAVLAADPGFKELVDEIVRLSTEHGILTEYTAFLATEGTDLARKDQLSALACSNLTHRAVSTRTGIASVNQGVNISGQLEQKWLNKTNSHYDQTMTKVEISAVQQIVDRTFFKRGLSWVDAGLLESAPEKPDEIVEFGSEAYSRVVEELIRQGRQAVLALPGDVLVSIGGRKIRLQAPAAPAAPAAQAAPAPEAVQTGTIGGQ